MGSGRFPAHGSHNSGGDPNLFVCRHKSLTPTCQAADGRAGDRPARRAARLHCLPFRRASAAAALPHLTDLSSSSSSSTVTNSRQNESIVRKDMWSSSSSSSMCTVSLPHARMDWMGTDRLLVQHERQRQQQQRQRRAHKLSIPFSSHFFHSTSDTALKC